MTRTAAAGWTFEGMGAEFDEHVAAHLPGYADVQHLIALIASYLLPPGGTYADFGASTGLTARTIADVVPGRKFTAYLYDSDQSMLDRAAERLQDAPDVTAHLIRADLPADGVQHLAADLTTALWLLQFLHPQQRLPLLRIARARTAPNGALVIATKTRMADPRWQEIADGALDDYKASRGVTPEQRTAKTASLRGVMAPDTVEKITHDLRAAGWHSPTLLWRWHVWSVIGAFAAPLVGQ